MRLPGRVAAAGVAAGLLLAGCSDPVDPESSEPGTVQLYGTDGIMQNSVAELVADRPRLRGMKGTAPLNPLPGGFADRLLEIDSSLSGFLFGGETYDAVVISALAAELAGTPDPAVVRGYVNSVTTGGEECTAVADCLELASAGEQLAYRGVSLRRGGFTDLGEPSAGTYGIQHFDQDGVIDVDKTEFVGAGDVSATTEAEPPEPGARPDGPSFQIEPLKIGGLLPETGLLSAAYPPMIAGARLAIQDINDAGGVFGVDVEWIDGDSGTNPEVARQTIESHVDEEVHVIIGAAASGVTDAVLPDAVAAGRILFSPSNTAEALSTDQDEGYYFRTAPSDDLQAAALADVILRDGVARTAIVALDDTYGRGLQESLSEALQQFGIPPSDITLITYPVPEGDDEPVPNLAGLVDEIIAAEPDGVVVIGFEEAAQVIQRMIDEGMQLEP